MLFVALRFVEDENIADRIYWYASEFSLKEGDRVLAPIGMRNRLQCAVVEEVRSCDRSKAPYDVSLIKWTEARLGARKFPFNEALIRDMGGVRYDRKRYTRFGKLLCGRGVGALSEEERQALNGYGVTQIFEFPATRGGEEDKEEGSMSAFLRSERAERVLYALADGHGCTLLYDGTDTGYAQAIGACVLSLHGVAQADILSDADTVGLKPQTEELLSHLSSVGGADAFLRDCGISDAHIKRLKALLY